MANPLSQDFTILVNSSDGFSDCWKPFFNLMDFYWPEHGSVLLNTEVRDWAHAPKYVSTSQVAIGEPRRLTWSECVIRGLAQVKTPLVLYMQEDYFLNRRVNNDLISQAVEKMISDPTIGHISLTRHGSLPPYLSYEDARFARIAPHARYRVSTQAGLWRRECLLSYLDPSENGWAFEILGTIRARRRPDTFLTAKYWENAGGPAIEYTHTGIIKGRWHPDIPALFGRHGIAVDFDIRGFYSPPNPVLAKLAVARKLAERPGHLVRQLIAR